MRREQLSRAEARRIALAAQGFADPRPKGRIDRRHLRRVVDRVGVVQLDSVNVLARTHQLPFLARLGPYPRDLLQAWAWPGPSKNPQPALFEYWAHEASLLPVEQQPLLRWRMDRGHAWGGPFRVARDRPDFVEAVFGQVAERGPLSRAQLEGGGERDRDSMWGWSDGKKALEWLFWSGRVAAFRTRHFERMYALPDLLLPKAVLDAPTPAPEDAQRALLVLAARAHGLGTARDLADYHRLHIPTARALLPELVEAGELLAVDVEGWREPAYLHPQARIPRRINAAALLSPFDSLIWERARTQRLFDFHYRIEIYVPAPQRIHGYYVLPFLLGDRLVARVDLKADRAAGRLLVRGAYLEGGADPAAVAEAMTATLKELGGWLELGGVDVADRGDLAPALRRATA